MDYTVAKAYQTPELEAVLVEVPSLIGPYGAKPVGEPPVIPGGAVIANAVFAACGARVKELPLTSERVQRAMANGHL
jgi:CO/xanthine dehydrogenase Mo-binding subunit